MFWVFILGYGKWQENVYRHLPVSLFLEASKREKQIQALEHAVNYLVVPAGVLMDGGTRTLSASLQVVNT